MMEKNFIIGQMSAIWYCLSGKGSDEHEGPIMWFFLKKMGSACMFKMLVELVVVYGRVAHQYFRIIVRI